MWQYNYTNNTQYGVNKNNSDVLFHSNHYLGVDYSDGIKHWKYIKKEKKNGKWRYYYRDINTEGIQKTIDDERKIVKEYTKMEDKFRQEPSPFGEYARNESIRTTREDIMQRNQKIGYLTKMKEDSERSDKIRKKIEKIIGKTLNDISDAIDNGKKWLKKLRMNNK